MALSIAKLVSLATGREIKTEDISEFGMNQTWQEAELTDTGAVFTDGTPKYRTTGVIYTNDTGGPIKVSINCFSGDVIHTLEVDGQALVSINLENGVTGNIQTTIPAGATYSLSVSSGFPSWLELRK